MSESPHVPEESSDTAQLRADRPNEADRGTARRSLQSRRQVRRLVLRHRAWYLAFDLATISLFVGISVTLIRLLHGGFTSEFALTGLLAIAAFVTGSVTALIFTPYSQEERRQWSALAGAIAGLLAGYSVATVSDAVEYLFSDARILTDATVGARAAIFVSWFGFAIVYGFTYRRYYVGLDLRAATPSGSEDRNPSDFESLPARGRARLGSSQSADDPA